MWADLLFGFIEASCKSPGQKTAEQKLAWCSSAFITVSLTFLDVSWLIPLLRAGILEGGKKNKKRL